MWLNWLKLSLTKDVKQEDNIMEDIQQTNQQHSNTEGKTFTQDEVNRIVSERLNKEKGKINADREAEYSKREQELNTRELKISARETLSEKNMPSELLDVLNYTSKEDMLKSIDILEKVIKSEVEKATTSKKDVVLSGFKPNGAPDVPKGEQAIRDAFRRK